MENMEKDMALNDDCLEEVTGGYGVGDTVLIRPNRIEYCPNCARLIANLPVTLTGVRGVLDGKTIYWVTYSCCGHRTSRIETDIL